MACELDISRWFDLGLKAGGGHLIVVRDSSRDEDYALYTGWQENVHAVAARYDGVNGQHVLGIYDLADEERRALGNVFAVPA